jgi:hypothetical protein
MRLTLVNQTDSPILYRPIPTTTYPSPEKRQLQIALLPSSSTTTDLPKRCSKLTLIRREQLKHDSSSDLGDTRLKEKVPENGVDVSVKFMGNTRVREVVPVGSQDNLCPWRIYQLKVSLPRLCYRFPFLM